MYVASPRSLLSSYPNFGSFYVFVFLQKRCSYGRTEVALSIYLSTYLMNSVKSHEHITSIKDSFI